MTEDAAAACTSSIKKLNYATVALRGVTVKEIIVGLIEKELRIAPAPQEGTDQASSD